MRKIALGGLLTLLLAGSAGAWELQVWNEFARVGPDGKLLETDWTGPPPEPMNQSPAYARIPALRNAHTSFVLVLKDDKGGPFTINVSCTDMPAVKLDLYRAWYHKTLPAPEPPEGARRQPLPRPAYMPDALVPLKLPAELALPMPDNRVPDQKAQMFWLDAWVPKDAPTGQATIKILISGDGRNIEGYTVMDVLPQALPDEDPIAADHNSYGTGWLAEQYPKLRQRVGDSWSTSDELFGLIHAYHKIYYEHRGTYHQLGYGHNGKVSEQFAPQLAGFGANRHPVSWELFDRHYGPLLDGSAFAGSFRPARPIPFVYLPITPEWPARFMLWGTPGYQAEFVNVVREMFRHFEAKGWTHTNFEMFFNHKKRYRGFSWDGDETRWPKDDAFFVAYGRLLAQARPPGTPVKIVFRHDASWMMREQWDSLNGTVDFWVCGGGMLSWFPWAPRELHGRNNIVWFYGGTPSAFAPAIMNLEYAARAWMWGVDGYCRWLTVQPGEDPWFAFDGAETGSVYSGERFGIEGPIPSVRLKIERNAVQDVAVLKMVAAKVGGEVARGSSATMSKSTLEDWWNPTPDLVRVPPRYWNNPDIGDTTRPSVIERNNLDATWWLDVRRAAIEMIQTNPQAQQRDNHEELFHGH